jgi:hypothetical protein
MTQHFFFAKKINHGFCRALTMAILFIIITNVQADSYIDQWEPSDWFQAEVIIFQHIESNHSELPPLKVELAYPDRWRRLIDTKKPIKIGDLARAYASADGTHNPLKKVFVENTYDFLSTDINNTGPISLSPFLTENHERQEKMAMPIFELPYSLVPSKNRNLNETAAGLRRRDMYQVLFHEAWRFPAENKARNRWIIIHAGTRFEDHYQLEGSIRFYKSRFMHFETKLWLTEFSRSDLSPHQVYLPKLGKSKLETKSRLNTKFPLNLSPNGQLDSKIVSREASIFAANTNEKSDHSDQPINDFYAKKVGRNMEDVDNLFSVEQVWTLEQARRLREAEIHYLDHPELGVIVTVNSYSPILLNPEDKPEPIYE